jgi:hypothetical protein
MGIIDFDPLYFGGRLIGCYTYMMLCEDGDNVHIKIGMSQEPQKRALTIYNNSPLIIEWMALVDMQSRERALNLERALHHALAKWRTNGEWFKFPRADKAEFNRLQQEALQKYQSPSRRLRWGKINVRRLAKQALLRQKNAQHKWKTSGQAYRDAVGSGLRNK